MPLRCKNCPHWVKNKKEDYLKHWNEKNYAPCFPEWEKLAELSKELGGNGWTKVHTYGEFHKCHLITNKQKGTTNV